MGAAFSTHFDCCPHLCSDVRGEERGKQDLIVRHANKKDHTWMLRKLVDEGKVRMVGVHLNPDNPRLIILL